jgi:rubrerythrin
MKAKLSNILTIIPTCAIFFIEISIDMFDNARHWLKGLFVKEKTIAEEAKNKDERTEQIEFRCQECGKAFLAEKEMIRFDYHAPMVPAPFDCPYCESIETMPVMFEQEAFYVNEYQRLWKRTLFLRKLIR